MMKVISLTFIFVLFSTSLFAQQLPTWYRVYTFDESIIEMNTSNLIFGGNIARVTFRWTFDQPEVLSSQSRLKYKSRQEVFEFNCVDKRYRPYEITFLDAAGKLIHTEEGNPPARWLMVHHGSMIERLFVPACELFKRETRSPQVISDDETELEKVERFAFSFWQRLEQAKDVGPIIQNLFAADYLNGYLHDKNTNWFFNLNRETAVKASPAELQRFYIALLNTGYLSSVFLISQYPNTDDGVTSEEKLIPPEIIELIDHHPYTAKYKGKQNNYDYLAENIDSIERLRSYTDLLESIGALMRKRVTKARAEHSEQYQTFLEDTNDLFQPRVGICPNDCLGLPKGTRLFEVKVPLFHLQIATIKGELRVVSAIDSSH